MEIEIVTEYIKLDQLLKFANVVENGAHAKELILNGEVKVDGIIETRRGRKIYSGMQVELFDEKILVK